jgi:hypothetical protein
LTLTDCIKGVSENSGLLIVIAAFGTQHSRGYNMMRSVFLFTRNYAAPIKV